MMSQELVFRACLLCDAIRPERYQKATILGFLGLAPDVQIKVKDPNLPISDLTFLFVSKRLTDLRTYHAALSIKDPSGVLMFPLAEQTVTLASPEIINLGYSFRPFRLAGPGTYNIYLIVDNKPDFTTSFSIVRAQPGELD